MWKRWHNTLHPAWIITRREITDMMRDWRIVFPIVILVTAFPFLANFAASRGLKFVNEYGARMIIERLFPFLMLTVGFFPSSFSLVIALETFVGEKERRSLEPLLATPLTNLQLYLGKLLAATLPPVLASYLGMAVYLVLLWLSVGWTPSGELLAVSMVLSTAEALVMVTGAVIISSQATSVRASNLLASFVIIPMAFLLQAEASMLLFANYALLWWIAVFLVVVDVLLVRLGVRLFDREHLLGRDLESLDVGRLWHAFWQALWPRYGLKALYTREIPAVMLNMRVELLITMWVIFGGGWIVGHWGVTHFPLPCSAFSRDYLISRRTIGEAVVRTGLLPSFSTWAIFVNNARSLVGAALLSLFSLGVLGGLILLVPLALLVYVGLQMGCLGVNPWVGLAVFVLPHGILELPVAILATAQAMKMGDIILAAPDAGGGVSGIFREMGHFVKLLLTVVLPLLLLAAWIEVHVTPGLVIRYLGG